MDDRSFGATPVARPAATNATTRRGAGRNALRLAVRALGIVVRAGLTLALALCVVMALMQAVPGDPVDAREIQPRSGAEAERARTALGYDKALPARLAAAFAGYLRGDLGISSSWGRPVLAVLAPAIAPTAILALAAIVAAYALGIAWSFAMHGARPRLSALLDRLALVLASVPRFWLGVVLVLVFHDRLAWLPASHASAPGRAATDAGAIDLAHLVLPVLTLALPAAAAIARVHHAAVREALRAKGARLALALGVAPSRILWRDGFVPALGTTLTLLALDLPAIVSGALVVEIVFAWPGLGRITADAVRTGDAALAAGAALLAGAAVVAANLAADALVRALDPRQRGARAETRP